MIDPRFAGQGHPVHIDHPPFATIVAAAHVHESQAHWPADTAQPLPPLRSRLLGQVFRETRALQRLLAAIRSRLIDVVVVYKVDRLTRSLTDFAKRVEIFDAHGVSFVSATLEMGSLTGAAREPISSLEVRRLARGPRGSLCCAHPWPKCLQLHWRGRMY
jgi:hypothetical protein